MTRLIALALAGAVIAGLGFMAAALADTPTDQVRARIEEVYRILTGSQSDAVPSSERRAAARRVVDRMFDWAEMAKVSLGSHWQERTPAERREFIRLFADLFEDAYLSKVKLVEAQGFRYLGETIRGDKALVETKVITKNGSEIPVAYRTRLEQGDQWRVNDLEIDGVSLVQNYRAQFGAVIIRSSFSGLLDKMKALAVKRRETSE